MGLIHRIFNIPTPDERAGAHLDLNKPHWILEGKTTLREFLHALRSFAPEDSVLYLEGGDPSGDLESFLVEASVPEMLHIALGTLWPKPVCFHIPATSDNIGRLIELNKGRATPELAVHVHLYHGKSVALEWHDAFDQSMFIDQAINEKSVRDFANALSMTPRLSDSDV